MSFAKSKGSAREHLGKLTNVVSDVSPQLARFYRYRMVFTDNTDSITSNSMVSSCLFCKLPFSQESAHMRLKPRPRLSNKIRRLLHHHDNQQTANMGKFHQKLVSDFLQSRNQMRIRCPSCKKTTRVDGQTHQERQDQKVQLTQPERPITIATIPTSPVPLTKQQKKKEKKKLKKRTKKLGDLPLDDISTKKRKRKNQIEPNVPISKETSSSSIPVCPVSTDTTETTSTSDVLGNQSDKSTQSGRKLQQTVNKKDNLVPLKTPNFRQVTVSANVQQPSKKKPTGSSKLSQPGLTSSCHTQRSTSVNSLNIHSNPLSKQNKRQKGKQMSQTLANILKQEKKKQQPNAGASLLDFLSSVS